MHQTDLRIISGKRQTRPPIHLKNYELDFISKQSDQDLPPQSTQGRDGSVSSSSLSRSQRSSQALREALNAVQSAVLEEQLRRSDLDELCKQQHEEEEAEKCYMRLSEAVSVSPTTG